MPHYASLTSAVLTVASLSLLLSSQHADAATLFAGSSTGNFGKPTIDSQTDPDALFSIEKTPPQGETFLLGEADIGSKPNRLTFSGTEFETIVEQAFAVGELSYFNGRTFIGTNVSSVPIDITVALANPVTTQHQFGYSFNFDLTPNVNASNADQLVISQNPVPQTFTVENDNYHIELLGFSGNNGSTVTRSFEASEDDVINTTLFVRIKLAAANRNDDINETSTQSIPESNPLPGLLGLTSTMMFLHQSRAIRKKAN